MKKFEFPEMEIEKFNIIDVITTSGDPNIPDLTIPDLNNGENNTGWG